MTRLLIIPEETLYKRYRRSQNFLRDQFHNQGTFLVKMGKISEIPYVPEKVENPDPKKVY